MYTNIDVCLYTYMLVQCIPFTRTLISICHTCALLFNACIWILCTAFIHIILYICILHMYGGEYEVPQHSQPANSRLCMYISICACVYVCCVCALCVCVFVCVYTYIYRNKYERPQSKAN